jgi:DNA polymerase-3 subunit alpha
MIALVAHLPPRARCSTSRATPPAKNGREPITYIDERLKEITQDSQGICIYQELVPADRQGRMAGFTGAEAETLRRAIGKKIHELMASLKPKFLDGCAANGVTPAVADQLWKDMESVQDYSFNKAHAGVLRPDRLPDRLAEGEPPVRVHGGAHLERHEHEGPVPFYVNAATRWGSRCCRRTSTRPRRLRGRRGEDPLRSERREERWGDGGAAIVAARADGGPFASIWDFTERVDPQVVNKRSLESLVKCGALDSTGASRMGMLGVLEQASGTDRSSRPTGDGPARS